MLALGGLIVPGLIYVAINRRSPAALHGWAIPTATDIAFSLGVLLLGATLWLSVLKSGVHATLAGGVLALFIPVKSAAEEDAACPAIWPGHVLKPWSA